MSFAADLKDFVKTFQATRDSAQKQRYYDYLIALAQSKKPKGEKPGVDDIQAQGERAFDARTSTPKEGRSVAVGDPVAEGLEPHQKAFLNAVASGESPGGAYNARYNGDTPATFANYDQHPNVPVQGPDGPSTAAGRYMFTKSTWDDYGGGKIDPATQDKRAWQLAVDRYKTATGGDLDKELQTNGLTPDITKALSPTWTSFRDPSNAIATYNDSYGRYTQPQNTASAVPVGDNIPLPPQRPADLTPQQTSALPLDPYNTEAVFAARGGLVPALPVKSYADGGTVDDDETDPTQYLALARAGADAGSAGPGFQMPQYSPLRNLPFSGLPDVLHDGITYLQQHFGLENTPSALPSDGQKKFASGEGAADKEDVDAVGDIVDPKKQMTDAQRHIAGLNAVYNYYQNRGEYDRAARAAASMLQQARTAAEQYGDAALRAPDPNTAAKIVAKGYNATVPDGKEISVGDDGTFVQRDAVSGKVIATGKFSPADVLQAAVGLKNGTAYWRQLMEVAGGSRKASAADQKAAAEAQAVNAFESSLGRSAGTQATPTQAVPTMPAVPASASDANNVDSTSDDDNTDTSPANAEGRSATGSTQKVGAVAAAAGVPGNYVDTLTSEQKSRFRALPLARQNQYQQEYERRIASQPQAAAPLKPADRAKIYGNLSDALDEKVDSMTPEGGKAPEINPTDKRGLKQLGYHLFSANNMSPADAIDAAMALTAVDPKNPKNLGFTVSKANNGAVQANIPNGPTVTLTPEAYEALKTLRARKMAVAQKQAEDAAKPSRISQAMEEIKKGLRTPVTPESDDQMIQDEIATARRRRAAAGGVFSGVSP